MSPETKKKFIGILVTALVAAVIAFLAKFGEGLTNLDFSMLDVNTSMLSAMIAVALS